MPLLQATHLSYQFDNGETLFRDISCTLNDRRVGLVGRNGAGKSLLVSLLTKQLSPTSGQIILNGKVATYSQLPSTLLDGNVTVAQFLGLDLVLDALKQVEQGSCDSRFFDLIGERWQLESELAAELLALNLPADFSMPCRALSGGELARLQLWQLFQSDADLLVLDEPSNHLDQQAKQWLIEQMAQFSGHILLVSHDRALLRHMTQIWELSSLGLAQYGGNYDFYAEQKSQTVLALERQLNSANKEQKRLELEAQKNREKAEQRAAKGNRMRRQGSQAKIILDGMKDSATASVSNRLKNERGRSAQIKQKSQAIKVKLEQVKAQKMHLQSATLRNHSIASIVDGTLPFGIGEPINLQVTAQSKLHLQGGNGSGKSTLLKVLLGHYPLRTGELRVNSPLYYLDQHFGLLRSELSMLENLQHFCHGVLESDARTLLAGIGFRRDAVYRLAGQLSGGEKMKLAMLVVSHQSTQPLLLLDEPDNHLDIEAKQLLASALNHYQGGFILVSHDEDFAEECGVSEKVVLR